MEGERAMMFLRNSFHSCAQSLLESRSDVAHWIAQQIISSQKFVVPDAGQMTAGMRYADTKDTFHLPYDQISLLRELDVGGINCEQIIVAVAPHLIPGLEKTSAAFFICDCIRAMDKKFGRATDYWGPTAPVGADIESVPEGIRAIYLQSANENIKQHFNIDSAETIELDGTWGALNGLSELFLMLSLSNTSTKLIEAPAKLNKKRERSGKLPLYDYHVLLIDGKEVCSNSGDAATDRMMRSHFRRGHIRRLGEGRRVWVNRAFVHGRAAGFVDKDYLVTTNIAVETR